MSGFVGKFGDKRRAVALARLEEEMVSQSSMVVRRLGRGRGGEISYHRALSAAEVTAAEIVECLSGRAGKTPGFLIHAAVAIEADEETVLGLVDAANTAGLSIS
jgi:hypothetical protein